MQVDSSLVPNVNEIKKPQRAYENLNIEANLILQQIGEEIEIACQNNKQKVQFTVPSILKVDGFSNSTSQSLILHQIIKVLESKSYKVLIAIKKVEIILYITWVSEQEKLELETIQEFIKQRSQKKNHIPTEK
jgi:hypothetical protein